MCKRFFLTLLTHRVVILSCNCIFLIFIDYLFFFIFYSAGRKDELISRLQQYLDGESEGNNNREMSVAEPQNASKGVSKSKQPRATSVFDKENVMQQLTNITEILGDQKSTGLEKKSRKLLSKNVMFLNIEDADEVVGLND